MSGDAPKSPLPEENALWGTDENQDIALNEALKAQTRAFMINRFFSFNMDGNFEIIFGSARAVIKKDGTIARQFSFPCAVSLNYWTAKSLKDHLDQFIVETERRTAAQPEAAMQQAASDDEPEE